MPKEYVVSTWGEAAEGEYAEQVVSIGWNEGWVQLATFQRVIDTHETIDDVCWFTDLSRKDINKLIKKLRYARDRAYGRDE